MNNTNKILWIKLKKRLTKELSYKGEDKSGCEAYQTILYGMKEKVNYKGLIAN